MYEPTWSKGSAPKASAYIDKEQNFIADQSVSEDNQSDDQNGPSTSKNIRSRTLRSRKTKSKTGKTPSGEIDMDTSVGRKTRSGYKQPATTNRKKKETPIDHSDATDSELAEKKKEKKNKRQNKSKPNCSSSSSESSEHDTKSQKAKKKSRQPVSSSSSSSDSSDSSEDETKTEKPKRKKRNQKRSLSPKSRIAASKNDSKRPASKRLGKSKYFKGIFVNPDDTDDTGDANESFKKRYKSIRKRLKSASDDYDELKKHKNMYDNYNWDELCEKSGEPISKFKRQYDHQFYGRKFTTLTSERISRKDLIGKTYDKEQFKKRENDRKIVEEKKIMKEDKNNAERYTLTWKQKGGGTIYFPWHTILTFSPICKVIWELIKIYSSFTGTTNKFKDWEKVEWTAAKKTKNRLKLRRLLIKFYPLLRSFLIDLKWSRRDWNAYVLQILPFNYEGFPRKVQEAGSVKKRDTNVLHLPEDVKKSDQTGLTDFLQDRIDKERLQTSNPRVKVTAQEMWSLIKRIKGWKDYVVTIRFLVHIVLAKKKEIFEKRIIELPPMDHSEQEGTFYPKDGVNFFDSNTDVPIFALNNNDDGPWNQKQLQKAYKPYNDLMKEREQQEERKKEEREKEMEIAKKTAEKQKRNKKEKKQQKDDGNETTTRTITTDRKRLMANALDHLYRKKYFASENDSRIAIPKALRIKKSPDEQGDGLFIFQPKNCKKQAQLDTHVAVYETAEVGCFELDAAPFLKYAGPESNMTNQFTFYQEIIKVNACLKGSAEKARFYPGLKQPKLLTHGLHSCVPNCSCKPGWGKLWAEAKLYHLDSNKAYMATYGECQIPSCAKIWHCLIWNEPFVTSKVIRIYYISEPLQATLPMVHPISIHVEERLPIINKKDQEVFEMWKKSLTEEKTSRKAIFKDQNERINMRSDQMLTPKNAIDEICIMPHVERHELVLMPFLKLESGFIRYVTENQTDSITAFEDQDDDFPGIDFSKSNTGTPYAASTGDATTEEPIVAQILEPQNNSVVPTNETIEMEKQNSQSVEKQHHIRQDSPTHSAGQALINQSSNPTISQPGSFSEFLPERQSTSFTEEQLTTKPTQTNLDLSTHSDVAIKSPDVTTSTKKMLASSSSTSGTIKEKETSQSTQTTSSTTINERKRQLSKVITKEDVKLKKSDSNKKQLMTANIASKGSTKKKPTPPGRPPSTRSKNKPAYNCLKAARYPKRAKAAIVSKQAKEEHAAAYSTPFRKTRKRGSNNLDISTTSSKRPRKKSKDNAKTSNDDIMTDPDIEESLSERSQVQNAIELKKQESIEDDFNYPTSGIDQLSLQCSVQHSTQRRDVATQRLTTVLETPDRTTDNSTIDEPTTSTSTRTSSSSFDVESNNDNNDLSPTGVFDGPFFQSNSVEMIDVGKEKKTLVLQGKEFDNSFEKYIKEREKKFMQTKTEKEIERTDLPDFCKKFNPSSEEGLRLLKQRLQDILTIDVLKRLKDEIPDDVPIVVPTKASQLIKSVKHSTTEVEDQRFIGSSWYQVLFNHDTRAKNKNNYRANKWKRYYEKHLAGYPNRANGFFIQKQKKKQSLMYHPLTRIEEEEESNTLSQSQYMQQVDESTEFPCFAKVSGRLNEQLINYVKEYVETNKIFPPGLKINPPPLSKGWQSSKWYKRLSTKWLGDVSILIPITTDPFARITAIYTRFECQFDVFQFLDTKFPDINGLLLDIVSNRLAQIHPEIGGLKGLFALYGKNFRYVHENKKIVHQIVEIEVEKRKTDLTLKHDKRGLAKKKSTKRKTVPDYSSQYAILTNSPVDEYHKMDENTFCLIDFKLSKKYNDLNSTIKVASSLLQLMPTNATPEDEDDDSLECQQGTTSMKDNSQPTLSIQRYPVFEVVSLPTGIPVCMHLINLCYRRIKTNELKIIETPETSQEMVKAIKLSLKDNKFERIYDLSCITQTNRKATFEDNKGEYKQKAHVETIFNKKITAKISCYSGCRLPFWKDNEVVLCLVCYGAFHKECIPIEFSQTAFRESDGKYTYDPINFTCYDCSHIDYSKRSSRTAACDYDFKVKLNKYIKNKGEINKETSPFDLNILEMVSTLHCLLDNEPMPFTVVDKYSQKILLNHGSKLYADDFTLIPVEKTNKFLQPSGLRNKDFPEWKIYDLALTINNAIKDDHAIIMVLFQIEYGHFILTCIYPRTGKISAWDPMIEFDKADKYAKCGAIANAVHFLCTVASNLKRTHRQEIRWSPVVDNYFPQCDSKNMSAASVINWIQCISMATTPYISGDHALKHVLADIVRNEICRCMFPEPCEARSILVNQEIDSTQLKQGKGPAMWSSVENLNTIRIELP